MFATATILGSTSTIDTDAITFLNNAAITDATTVNALNNLVINAKQHGWWQLCSAIYPFAGGTATSCKFNLKDPRDLDAAFRIVFSSGWTFASTGATSDGAGTTFGDTKLVPNSVVTLNDAHMSIYSRTSAAGSATSSDLGATNSATQNFTMILRRSNNACFSIIMTSGLGGTITTLSIANGSGYWMGSRTNSTTHMLFRNGSLITTNSNANAGTLIPTVSMYIAATNLTGSPTNVTSREYAFATIGSGVNTTIAPLMYADIQAFQTALGRQV